MNRSPYTVTQNIDTVRGNHCRERSSQDGARDSEGTADSALLHQSVLSPRWSQAIFLLGHMQHDPNIIASIMEALQDTCPSVRAAAVEALADKDLSGGRARKSIEELLQLETDPVVLRKAAESLGRIGTYNTISVLAPHTINPNTQTRKAVKKAILDIRERQA